MLNPDSCQYVIISVISSGIYLYSFLSNTLQHPSCVSVSETACGTDILDFNLFVLNFDLGGHCDPTQQVEFEHDRLSH